MKALHFWTKSSKLTLRSSTRRQAQPAEVRAQEERTPIETEAAVLAGEDLIWTAAISDLSSFLDMSLHLFSNSRLVFVPYGLPNRSVLQNRKMVNENDRWL